MSIIDHLKRGKVIIFNTFLFKLRWAFCIDANSNDEIIYRGIFGLKAVDKQTFLSFARVIDVFDYIDRELTTEEQTLLKITHLKTNLMKESRTVKEYIDRLFRTSKIDFIANPEGWKRI